MMPTEIKRRAGFSVTMTNSVRELLPASVNLRYDLNGNLLWDGL
jgi:hypothetical protein